MNTLREDLRRTLPVGAAFAILFAICYGGASWITGQYASLPAWDLPFEQRIPFVPATSVVYLSLTPALCLALLIFRRRSELAPFAAVLGAQVLIATACFLVFPQTTSFVRPPVIGWARWPFELADTMNLRYNHFPSLHVSFAFSAACAYGQRTGVLGKTLWALWSVAVAASTVLMWEHHVVDIAGGLILALASMTLLYPRLRRREVQAAIGIELSCLAQCARFSRRHLRYFVIFLAIYLPSLLHWRRYRAVRTGFCAAQWIDDLLDGDRPSAREPLHVVEELVVEMERGEFSTQPLSRLTAAFFRDLPASARAEFIALVRTMQRDRLRVLRGEIWPANELREHHRATFALSVNLMLIAAGCTARAEEAPSLIDTLGWCSVFRDLDDDLRKGLVNVPEHVWRSWPDAAAAWAGDEHRRALPLIARASEEVAAIADPRARRILGIFQTSVASFARKRRGLPAAPLAVSS
jgi:membrane-associated phospholipid phosphatase